VSPCTLAPNVSSVFPTRGAVRGGTRVTMEGVNFPSTGRVVCKFGTTPVAALRRTATQVVCASPALRAGMSTVEVSVNKQDFTMTGLQFQYAAMPLILGISPKTGPMFGGTLIAVHGDHFTAESNDEGTQCRFASNSTSEAITYVVSSRLLRCEVPEGDLGNAHIELSINSLDTTSDLQMFRLLPPPDVEGVYPLAGSEAGGGIVAVQGRGLFILVRFSAQLDPFVSLKSHHPTYLETSYAVLVGGANGDLEFLDPYKVTLWQH